MYLKYHSQVIKINLVIIINLEFTFGNSQTSRLTHLGGNKINPNINYINFKESTLSKINIEDLSTSRKNENEVMLDGKEENILSASYNSLGMDKLDEKKRKLSDRLNRAKRNNNSISQDNPQEHVKPISHKTMATKIKSKVDLLENILKGIIN
jgi:hypothetical protein